MRDSKSGLQPEILVFQRSAGQSLSEHFRRCGLGEVAVESSRRGGRLNLIVAKRTQCNGFYRRTQLRAELPPEFDAVHIRHNEIDKDHLRLECLNQRQSRRTAVKRTKTGKYTDY